MTGLVNFKIRQSVDNAYPNLKTIERTFFVP